MEQKEVIPPFVCKEARSYVQDVIKSLEENNLLEEVDSTSLKMLAINYDQFLRATKQINKDGLTLISDRGNVVAHPLIKVAKDAQTMAMKIMQEFGLMLKSRTKISAIQTMSEESPLDAFFKGDEE